MAQIPELTYCLSKVVAFFVGHAVFQPLLLSVLLLRSNSGSASRSAAKSSVIIKVQKRIT